VDIDIGLVTSRGVSLEIYQDTRYQRRLDYRLAPTSCVFVVGFIVIIFVFVVRPDCLLSAPWVDSTSTNFNRYNQRHVEVNIRLPQVFRRMGLFERITICNDE
jgi:hypothetical protein